MAGIQGTALKLRWAMRHVRRVPIGPNTGDAKPTVCQRQGCWLLARAALALPQLCTLGWPVGPPVHSTIYDGSSRNEPLAVGRVSCFVMPGRVLRPYTESP